MTELQMLIERHSGWRDQLKHAQDQRDYWEGRCENALKGCQIIGQEILAEERRVQE